MFMEMVWFVYRTVITTMAYVWIVKIVLNTLSSLSQSRFHRIALSNYHHWGLQHVLRYCCLATRHVLFKWILLRHWIQVIRIYLENKQKHTYTDVNALFAQFIWWRSPFRLCVCVFFVDYATKWVDLCCRCDDSKIIYPRRTNKTNRHTRTTWRCVKLVFNSSVKYSRRRIRSQTI